MKIYLCLNRHPHMHDYSSISCSYQNVDVTKKFHAKKMNVQMVVNNLSNRIQYNLKYGWSLELWNHSEVSGKMRVSWLGEGQDSQVVIFTFAIWWLLLKKNQECGAYVFQIKNEPLRQFIADSKLKVKGVVLNCISTLPELWAT